MDVHKNARLTPRGREEMVRAVVEQGLTPAQAARRFMTTAKTVRTWVDRYRKQGVTGLRDRSSRPHSSPRRTPAAICQAAETLRRQRHTQCHIASALGLSYFERLGIRVEHVMTDNGSCYRSRAFANACRALGIRHIMTKPYTPQTNGKAERFIQTALREWAYATAFETSDERKAALPEWLHRYNWHRPHASLDKKPPISRIRLTQDNLLQLHS
ncbi:MAG: integrase core domain-containing protein [Hyphomicrobiaceae bacterium]